MKKWLISALCGLFLAALVSVPVGCGSGKASKIDTSDTETGQSEGHEQAVEQMNKDAARKR